MCDTLVSFCSSSLKPHVSASGSPANRTQRDPVISRIQATSLRLPIQSGTSESNREPPAPKAGVLPSAPLPECFQSERQGPIRPVGRSVPEPAFSWPPAKRDNQASPRSDRLRAPRAQVGWEVLEPSSAAFQATAKPSQLPARQPVVISPQRSAASAVLLLAQQKTRCLMTPGLRWESPQGVTGVTSVTDARADYSPPSC
jgi:hypothetical protein